MESITSIILGLLCSGSCCLVFFVLFLAIVGTIFLRKRGKKKVSAREAIKVGADVSRAFIRGQKSREELLREAELNDDD